MKVLYDECIDALRDNKCSECNDFYQCSVCDYFQQRYEQGRTDAIEEFRADTINKISFEEKWLFRCKSNNADTNIAFSALKTFVDSRAEQLKEQK